MPILGTPGDVEPLPVDEPWPGLSAMTWTGWDGTEWDLLGRTGGVFVLDTGCRGLGMPPVNRYTDVSPALAGSRWRGHRVLEREVFWPLLLFADGGSVAWQEYDAAWWATMRPDQVGSWAVTGPAGRTRSLGLRFVDDDDHAVTTDPARRGWAEYGLRLVAEQPWWVGDPVRTTWENVTTSSFFGGTAGGSGPPFVIDRGSTVAAAVSSNPGDVDAWPVWEIRGPATAVTLGVAGRTLTWTGTLTGADTLTIDTDPARRTVTDQTGTNRVNGLDAAAKFGEIPPGQTVPLALALSGTGSVTMTIRPQHYRAW